MSRVGHRPIELPKGVTVSERNRLLEVRGPKGDLQRELPEGVGIEISEGLVKVTASESGGRRRSRANHGLVRALLQNMVTGVSVGIERRLEINGVGYRAEARPGVLALALGYSHPIEVLLPEFVSAKVEKNIITLSGVDKAVVGQVAAIIRDQRPPEPFKGKGVKYVEEHIRRKVGKAGAN